MIKFIFMLIVVFVLLFLFSGSFRTWLLMKMVQRIQRKAEEQMRASQGQSANYQRREQAHQREEEVKPTGKVEMDDTALRKIQRPHSEDYVDYEEVSK